MATGFKTATVNASSVPATQTDFPSYVDLSRLGITTLAEAQSVRVYADSGKTTEWAREIVSATEMHVKVPSLTSTTAIYVEWDGSSADYAATDTYGRNAVWSDYVAVYHFESDDTNSTGGTAATDTSVTYSSGNGLFGNGGGFNGSSSKIYTNINLGSNPTFSVSLWEKSSYAGTNYINLMTLCDQQTSNTGTQIYFFLEGSTDYMAAEGGGVNLRPASGNDAITGNWTHGVWQQDYGANQSKIYFNGSLQDTDVKHSSTFNNWMRISIFGNNAGFFDGSMDEIKVRASYLSANWITTEYNNQSDEATFWGTWSTVSGGGSTFVPKVQFLT